MRLLDEEFAVSPPAFQSYSPLLQNGSPRTASLPDYLKSILQDVQSVKREGTVTPKSVGQSLLVHAMGVGIIALFFVLSSRLGWRLPEIPPPELPMNQKTQIEFVVVNNTQAETPRDLKTRNRAKVSSRSGGSLAQTNTLQEAQQVRGGQASIAQNASQRGSQGQEAAAPKAQSPQKSAAPWWKKMSPSQNAPVAVRKATTKTVSVGGRPQSKSDSSEGEDDLLTPVTQRRSQTGGKANSNSNATRMRSTGTGAGSQTRSASSANVTGAGGNGSLNSEAKTGGGGGLAGVDAIADVDMSPYISQINRRIYRNWRPSSELSSLTSEYTLTISRSGQLLNYRRKRSSGNLLFEELAVAAITATTFPALPVGFKGQSIVVDFYFDYDRK
jgi:hypothetical protein